jgi:hypothetical protein
MDIKIKLKMHENILCVNPQFGLYSLSLPPPLFLEPWVWLMLVGILFVEGAVLFRGMVWIGLSVVSSLLQMSNGYSLLDANFGLQYSLVQSKRHRTNINNNHKVQS